MKWSHKTCICFAAMGAAFALAVPASGAVSSVYDVAARLNLVPAPREIRLTGNRAALKGWSVFTANNGATLAAAAAEINSRIVEIGGAALPVHAGGAPPSPSIVIGSAADPAVRAAAAELGVRVSREDPGEQGYVIAFGRRAILLAGSDEQGALYAAVTFRSLLVKEKDGVAALAAAVRDWPDFKLRGAGSLAASDAAAARREIDFYLRHKINCLSARRPPAREVAEYARARGILLRYGAGVELSGALAPAERSMAIERSPGTAFIWGAWESHRRRAARFAESLRGLPPGMVSLHPLDFGGYIDPEKWSLRGPRVTGRYGDDRARASLEQFAAWFDAARAASPGTLLEAVVYPYHFQFAVADFPLRWRDHLADPALAGMVRPIKDAAAARAVQSALVAYHKRMHAGLPAGTHVVFREAGRAEFDACAALYPGRPITIWTYPDRNNGWLGSYCPQVRFAKTFWRPGRRDLYYAASAWRHGDARVQRLAQVEYLWNVDRPDAADAFTTLHRSYERGGQVTEFQRTNLIPRICRILYGDAAAVIEPVIAANISLHSIAFPDGRPPGPDADDFDPAAQTVLVKRLLAGLEKHPAANVWVDFWRDRLARSGPVRLPDVTRRNETVTYGYATVLSFRIEPAAAGPVQIRDARGVLLAKLEARSGRLIVDLGDVIRGDLLVTVAGKQFRVDEKGAVR